MTAFESVPLVLPSIKINKKIGIPMTDKPTIDRNNINEVRLVRKEERKNEEFEVIED